jgi:adenosylhomocysteine nucleosidase
MSENEATRRVFLLGALAPEAALRFAVLISANAEWKPVRGFYSRAAPEKSPYGEYFFQDVGGQRVLFFHGGWGKIDAAGSTQYVIDRWKPEVLFNLGTCGGFAGRIGRFEVVVGERTVVYDIVEQMGDAGEAIRDYTTAIDLSWIRGALPSGVRKGTLVSADRDVLAGDVEQLASRYGAAAADWESGAIARVAARNGKRLVILRGVTDLVSAEGGEAYGNEALFEKNTAIVMRSLLESLPGWLRRAG